MAHDGRVQNRGVKFGCELLTRARRNDQPPASDSLRFNTPRVAARIKSPRTIARNLGYPDDPGTTTEVPSFALENLRQNKGVKLGARVWPNEKIETSEGSTTAVPSFAECVRLLCCAASRVARLTVCLGLLRVASRCRENKRAGKGVKFGIRPKTPRTIAENLGYPQMPGPDYYFRSDMPR